MPTPFGTHAWVRSLVYFLMLLPLSTMTTACGSGYDTSNVKEYRLAVVNGGSEWKEQFRSLILDFNRFAGLTVLQYVDNAAQANSAIIVTEGLKDRDRKVGWGQWITETESESSFGKLPGERVNRIVRYSMRVEFDAKYFRDRMQSASAKNTYEMQKLFFHEVGHGLEMDHAPDAHNVMYENIEGDKDFELYFQRVRSYMADS